MPKYASFDPALDPDPAPVLGWYDTDAVQYGDSLPASLLLLTAGQWAGRFPNPSAWAVRSGALIPYTPAPIPLTLDQQTDIAFGSKLAIGITLISPTMPEVGYTYALDPVSTAQIFQVGTYAATFSMFPAGGSTMQYPDIGGNMRTFDIPHFIAFLHATAALMSELQTQAGVMRNGGSPSWPIQTVTII